MVVAMLVLIGLIAGDKIQFLNFLTAESIAAAIWIVGGIGFLVKLVFWRIQKRRDANDPEQA
jgi:beta-lactamase regulating signal transducer with metallopeptidase domain